MSTTTKSRLGIHAFRYANGNVHGNKNRIQKTVSDIINYETLVDVPIDIFVNLFGTKSDEMYYLNNAEALKLGIKIWSIKGNCFLGDSNCLSN